MESFFARLGERYRYSLVLLKELVRTDFKLRYEGSVLGMVWSALKPLMLFAVMYVVFVHFLKFGAGIPHFAVALLLGMVLWTFFAEAVGQGMRAIVDRGDILRKISIPKYVVVISTTMSALINLGINLIVVLIFAFFNGVEFSWSLLLLIPLILELFAFSIAVSFLLSALFVKFRDIAPIWDVFAQALFYATPIFYPLSMVIGQAGSATGEFIAKMILMSPLAQIIQDARNVAIYPTETVWGVFRNPFFALLPIIFVLIITAVSVLYFRRASKRFTELI